MKIIGHRGAAGSELENTLASLQTAVDLGVAGIELDIRKTKDNQLVVCHDADLSRVGSSRKKISQLTLEQLQKIPLHGGAHVPTLSEALEVIGSKPVYIELKASGCSRELLAVLQSFPKAKPHVLSFKLEELVVLRELAPKLPLYGSERTKPLEIIRLARRLRFNGVCLNYWLLNPLTYILCRRAKLDLIVYTVNHPFQVRFLGTLYPKVGICTDYPERFTRKRRLHV
ncbi:MAG TPA: glycerophosphodiester phosphodiesterase family protein [Patescibacteria group bacterium]|nr:glycerophosphodiester phosphodiesterase family protein [Patescibacteria group bacterium]